jgi:superfamily II DNA/RNA helicase
LYKHQEESIRKIIEGRNIVISSSTSSGKTECFLFPIYNYLIKQYRDSNLNPGVRVLLLYPMNALVNDQLRKLREISYAIEKNITSMRITFGRYTGDTKEHKKDAYEQFKTLNTGMEPPESELLSREEMRENPPNILISNYAMLEYLLLRPEDDIFFSGQYGNNWKYIVLDEAHVYNGTAGMEIGMLLRRIKQKVNQNSNKEISCIISSATLISKRSDFKKVIQFAKSLFSENFEWNDKNKDIVIGRRKYNQINPKFSLTKNEFNSLYNAIYEYKINDNIEVIKDWTDTRSLKVLNEENVLEKLYEYLKYEENIIKIKNLLKESALSFEYLTSKFYQKDLDVLESEDIIYIKKILEIGIWLKESKNHLSLIPSRFHFFLRSPESVFISFYTEKKIFLERHLYREYREQKYPVFEMHICKRCGQIYFFGETDQDGKYKQLENQLFIDEKRTLFLMISVDDDFSNFSTDLYENEEKLCVKCGKILRRGNCECDDPKYYPIKIIQKKGRKLTKCESCNYSSLFTNRSLFLGRDSPSAVIATNLFQNSPKGEKLLTFADSRQKAAFFAPFLEFTYELILFRHLIFRVIKKNTVEDFRLEDLAIQLKELCDKKNIFSSVYDDVVKYRKIWRYVITEFYNISSRNSLETIGLINFNIVFPSKWSPPKFLKEEPWNLKNEEIRDLYQIIINSLRKSKAFSMPVNGPNYDDEIFERVGNKKEWFIKGLKKRKSKSWKKAIISFLPVNGKNYSNSRIDFLRKILKNSIKKSEEIIKKISHETLSKIWKDIFENWIAKCEENIFYSDELGYQLNHKFWNVNINDPEDLYLCEKCGHITTLNVNNICPTYRCQGKLIKNLEKINQFQKNNHFSYLYENFKLYPLKAKEHTAQLTTEKATETQIEFLKGKINLLSCSTTFELGVDLGELQIIFLTNIPPQPANYVQRSGRAGRRKESAGFTVTFALLRSHDLYYFKDPLKMINGYISPPVVNIKNKKIISRHINALILSHFFKENPIYYSGDAKRGEVRWFFFNSITSKQSAYEKIRNFITENFDNLKNEIKHILPQTVDKKNFLNLDFILNNLFSESTTQYGEFGKLYLAKVNTVNDIEKLNKLKFENLEKYREAKNGRARNKINYFINWLDKRIDTTKKEYLINFLSRNSIIPKYGFPIDVVPLDILNDDQDSRAISLDRDLRIAISEYAPGSSVIANAKIWKSVGLKVLKDQTWPIYEYLNCPFCSQFNLRSTTLTEDLTENEEEYKCIKCGKSLENNAKSYFIDPIFGFVTDREEKPKKPGREIPQRQYYTRPFFSSITPIKQGTFEIIKDTSNISMNWEYSPNGELTILCKGRKDRGFNVCFKCGRSWDKSPKLKKNVHKDPYGNDCNGKIKFGLHLGHRFQTDILKITFSNYKELNIKVGYSLLYAILEGISEVLNIERSDLNGCLINKNENENDTLIIFDDVPGGAGHVMRVVENEKTFSKILEASKDLLETCNCGMETSCYNCLRNYDNQFCHDNLKKIEAIDVFKKIPFEKVYEKLNSDGADSGKIDYPEVPIDQEKKQNNQKTLKINQMIDEFELRVRSFIEDQLKEKHEDNWWEKGIPENIRNQINHRMEREKKIEPNRTFNKIDFCTMYDYKLIIFRKKNWDIFSEFFPEKNIQYLFDRLTSIRNSIKHARFYEEDLVKCETYINDILKYIPN